MLKRYRTDGTIEPRAHGGGQIAKLSREQEAVVATLVEENIAIVVKIQRFRRRSHLKAWLSRSQITRNDSWRGDRIFSSSTWQIQRN